SPEETFAAAPPASLTHAFANEADRTISVTLVDEDGTYASVASKPVTVQNVAPVLTGAIPSATSLLENDVLTLAGTFVDPGTRDAHTVKILWGDGSAEQTVALAAGIFEFT